MSTCLTFLFGNAILNQTVEILSGKLQRQIFKEERLFGDIVQVNLVSILI